MRRVRIALALLCVLVSASLSLPVGATPIGGNGQWRYGVGHSKGFDACAAPSLALMGTWWTYSPYYSIGIYVGGSARACSQPNLTTAWLQSAHGYGYSFYPTWVGPQMSCSGFASRMSSDPTTAWWQGMDNANQAVSAMVALGLDGYQVVYYDLEGVYNASTGCRNAAKSFVDGWVYRLHSYYGWNAGMYGSSCTSYPTDWATIGSPPDTVWIANYNGDPDVWGLSCLPDGYWAYDQRLHQWQGGHNETWGGFTLNMDNNCEKGPVSPHTTGGFNGPCTYE